MLLLNEQHSGSDVMEMDPEKWSKAASKLSHICQPRVPFLAWVNNIFFSGKLGKNLQLLYF